MKRLSALMMLLLASGTSCREQPKVVEKYTVVSLLGRDPRPGVRAGLCSFSVDAGPDCVRTIVDGQIYGALCSKAGLKGASCAAAFRTDGGSVSLDLERKVIVVDDAASFWKTKATERLTVVSLLGEDPTPLAIAGCYFIGDGGPTCKRDRVSEMIVGKLCTSARLEFDDCAAAFRVDGGAVGLELDDTFIWVEDATDFEMRLLQ